MSNFSLDKPNSKIEISHITDLEQPFLHSLERFGAISKALQAGIMTPHYNGGCKDCVERFLSHASKIVLMLAILNQRLLHNRDIAHESNQHRGPRIVAGARVKRDQHIFVL